MLNDLDLLLRNFRYLLYIISGIARVISFWMGGGGGRANEAEVLWISSGKILRS